MLKKILITGATAYLDENFVQKYFRNKIIVNLFLEIDIKKFKQKNPS
jgi:hypothetical protein